jgi:flagellar biosynthesis protein FlhB
VSEDQDPDSKTEEPSEKRLADAREKGQVVKTPEMTHVMALLAMWIVIVGLLPSGFHQVIIIGQPFIEYPHAMAFDGANIGRILVDVLLETILILLVPFLLFMAGGILSTYLQVGFLFNAEEAFKLKFNKLNVFANLAQKFSGKNLVEFLKSLVKLSVVGVVVTLLMKPLWGSVDYLISLSVRDLLLFSQDEAASIIMNILLIVSAMAGADYMYQKYSFTQSMRMTKQEVKDEFKQSEGDPIIKGRLRQLRMQKARSRMMAAVPQADVVVTNPTHYAVALAYKPQEMSAPVVLAKGVDKVAAKIREIAEKNDIPLVENPPLARALYATAEIEDEIPAEHYQAVAQVISYVFKLKRKPM